MNYLSDLHTHSIVSGHAYSSLLENIAYCKENGIKILGTSEHGPMAPGAPHEWYFGNLRILPRYIDGVLLLKGCEANIMDVEGNIDLDERQYRHLDYMIGSLHEFIFDVNCSLEDATNAVINCITKNPKIEILGHLGNPNYKLDYKRIVEAAKKHNIMIEINNTSLAGSSRPGSNENCLTIAKLCKEIGTKVIVSSDAHFCQSICKFKEAISLLDNINMPEELIMNEPEKLIAHLKSKGHLEDI